MPGSVPPILIPVAPTHGMHSRPRKSVCSDHSTHRRGNLIKVMDCFLELTGVENSNERRAWSNAWNAAVQRNKTYCSEASSAARRAVQAAAHDAIRALVPAYMSVVSADQHEQNIAQVSDLISDNFGPIFDGGRLRIGTCQKFFNLFLKFLWCFGRVHEPPQCPLDRLSQIAANVSAPTPWTRIDSLNQYRTALHPLVKAAQRENLSLAEWELRFGWRRSIRSK